MFAVAKNAVLLPTHRRVHAIPRLKGGMGQSNVRYVLDSSGQPSIQPWMQKAITYVRAYNAENWLRDPLAELPRTAEDEIDAAAGYESNPRIRRAVELRAMKLVRTHYETKKFAVEDKSATESFDFLCTKGKRVVHVEVKGTRTKGDVIALTANEVALAQNLQSAVDLCVVHSIVIKEGKEPTASGGKLLWFPGWKPSDHKLRPVHYECRLSEALAR
jgi:hypothetical protein